MKDYFSLRLANLPRFPQQLWPKITSEAIKYGCSHIQVPFQYRLEPEFPNITSQNPFPLSFEFKIDAFEDYGPANFEGDFLLIAVVKSPKIITNDRLLRLLLSPRVIKVEWQMDRRLGLDVIENLISWPKEILDKLVFRISPDIESRSWSLQEIIYFLDLVKRGFPFLNLESSKESCIDFEHHEAEILPMVSSQDQTPPLVSVIFTFSEDIEFSSLCLSRWMRQTLGYGNYEILLLTGDHQEKLNADLHSLFALESGHSQIQWYIHQDEEKLSLGAQHSLLAEQARSDTLVFVDSHVLVDKAFLQNTLIELGNKPAMNVAVDGAKPIEGDSKFFGHCFFLHKKLFYRHGLNCQYLGKSYWPAVQHSLTTHHIPWGASKSKAKLLSPKQIPFWDLLTFKKGDEKDEALYFYHFLDESTLPKRAVAKAATRRFLRDMTKIGKVTKPTHSPNA